MKFKFLGLLLVALFSITYSEAADINAGKSKAAVCAACHGPEGISFIPLYPNLKGQKSAYMVKQLKDFKAKNRKDPVMTAQASSLSEEDMVNISAYYESLGAQ